MRGFHLPRATVLARVARGRKDIAPFFRGRSGTRRIGSRPNAVMGSERKRGLAFHLVSLSPALSREAISRLRFCR